MTRMNTKTAPRSATLLKVDVIACASTADRCKRRHVGRGQAVLVQHRRDEVTVDVTLDLRRAPFTLTAEALDRLRESIEMYAVMGWFAPGGIAVTRDTYVDIARVPRAAARGVVDDLVRLLHEPGMTWETA
jgi:hypothetical protein